MPERVPQVEGALDLLLREDLADRGVRVRLLLDDMFTSGYDVGLAALHSHPNFEIRIFNPWAHKGVGRLFETVGRAKRLNHRMHNKLLIADGRIAILGGRNIGDHYFGLHHKYSFHDLDIVVIGDEATESSEIFDHFWNSEWVVAASNRLRAFSAAVISGWGNGASGGTI